MTAPAGRRALPVAADAVRVWRGFRNPVVDQAQFFAKLGSVFIPATVQVQAPNGLTAYLPSVLPAEKPSGAPDEIALVFYEYQDAYDEAKQTVGGRSYSDMHALVFDLSRSQSGFPVPFDGAVEADQRYHLFDEPVDWQFGEATAYVGVPSGDTEAFLGQVCDFLARVQAMGDGGPDGAIAVANAENVVYWEHWPDGGGASLLPDLGPAVETVYHGAFAPQPLSEGLWEAYAGVAVSGGESFNTQFTRRLDER